MLTCHEQANIRSSSMLAVTDRTLATRLVHSAVSGRAILVHQFCITTLTCHKHAEVRSSNRQKQQKSEAPKAAKVSKSKKQFGGKHQVLSALRCFGVVVVLQTQNCESYMTVGGDVYGTDKTMQNMAWVLMWTWVHIEPCMLVSIKS